MIFRYIRYLRESFRAWVRQRTPAMTVAEAEERQFFWAKIYAFTALSVMIYTSFSVTSKAGVNDRFRATVYTSNASEKPLVVRYEGLKRVNKIPEDVEKSLPKPEMMIYPFSKSSSKEDDSTEFNRDLNS